MHCVELTRRIRAYNSASKVTANACHPGSVDTALIRAKFYQKYIKNIISPIIWFILVCEFLKNLINNKNLRKLLKMVHRLLFIWHSVKRLPAFLANILG